MSRATFSTDSQRWPWNSFDRLIDEDSWLAIDKILHPLRQQSDSSWIITCHKSLVMDLLRKRS